MNRRTALIIALLSLFLSLPGFAQKSLLVPGKMAGPVELGSDYGRAVAALGTASRIQPTASDPNTKLYYHKDLFVLVGTENKIIGITIVSPAYRTADGLGVGSLEHEIMKRLGQGLMRGQGNRTYANRGIGFSFDATGKATQVYIFRAEGDRPLLGDRLLVAGQRVGDVRLGMRFSLIEKAWGPPSKSKDMGNGEMLCSYPTNAVRIIVHDGIVDGILVTTGDYVTPQGLKVGVSGVGVQKVLGQSMHKLKNGLFYPQLGIGFVTESNQVTEIQILYPR